MQARKPTLADRRYVLEAVVFVCAGVGMTLELAGSRLMSPYFGNSLFVWTSLIGVILAFMSLGNYLGGRLGDRWIDATMLSWVLGWAALGVAVTLLIESSVLPALASAGNTRMMSVVAACVLFALPSMLLGIVSPYSIRMRMHGVEHSGATIGSLYAIATVGSIAGTFLAGFWLLSIMGTHAIVLLCVGLLAMLSVLLMGSRDWRKIALLGAVLVVALLASRQVATARASEVDTQYDRYMLRTAPDPATGRELIGLSRDMISAESASYIDTGEPFAFEYYGYYDLAAKLRPRPERALLIGGGTFSYPRLFLKDNPEASIDAVEIDGELVEVARAHFGFKDDPRLSLHLEDGRTFLNRATGPYDVIYMDAFKSEATVPYQLTTVESWQRCERVLTDDGILVMNVVASPTDSRAEFFNALYASISAVFPQVEVYAVQSADEAGALMNTSIIASKDPDFDIAAEIARVDPEKDAHRMEYVPPVDATLLTDDFAPVDQYLMGL